MSLKPNIIISSLDAERLDNLLESMANSDLPGLADLEDELDRATIVAPEEVPPTVVTMNSTVRFSVASSKETFCYTLVYPSDVKKDAKNISILAPVGSALLGMSQGDEIEWPKPGGGILKVRIEEIVDQPERNGDFQR
ncbi:MULTISPECIES: nucleoside diphosphate kinase regulator [Photobacterium]|uniref:Nucleoside diphosphate kinase regulator n=1 Tax=Photobacterium ganghwense TaxID=320778 RepID=A0A0J1HEI2_9GAMM|nr:MULTISPECIES: nucleoside diphosphate kinase regulator [Photobacterium]KLV10016.1 nucleoside diphosphate kinase regulator [Photobacterium ganghwense]MBV1840115.1 nucleoside diphosphate kinase regulator [Photobacterium ganghwense]PSU09126.1 nucleoside diphosphate kinase regulator [Photobacterium ganghwense]QSV16323.1 nucleoside diphosphate kinase regulator [Photobacterium ganghwense]